MSETLSRTEAEAALVAAWKAWEALRDPPVPGEAVAYAEARSQLAYAGAVLAAILDGRPTAVGGPPVAPQRLGGGGGLSESVGGGATSSFGPFMGHGGTGCGAPF